MSTDGHIITNQHVIDGAQAIQILLSDGRRASASVVGIDPDTDLALLKTDLTGLSPSRPPTPMRLTSVMSSWPSEILTASVTP